MRIEFFQSTASSGGPELFNSNGPLASAHLPRFLTRGTPAAFDSCTFACSSALSSKRTLVRSTISRCKRTASIRGTSETANAAPPAANIGAVSHHAGVVSATTSGGHSSGGQGGHGRRRSPWRAIRRRPGRRTATNAENSTT